MSDSEDPIIDEGDLFGDEEEEEEEAQPTRALSDKELDSGDDEDRNDRTEEPMDVDDSGAVRNAQILEIELGRQSLPSAPDRQIHSFRLPEFLGLDPMPYNSDDFQKPTTDHHSDTQSKDFSAAEVAATTIRYQKNKDTGAMESNTLISRWSDGSVTLHIGENDYELLAQPLCQTDSTKPYEPKQDSHQYLCTPHAESSVLQVIGHITNQYSVMANTKVADVALLRLKASLKATKKSRLNLNGDKDSGMQIITQTEDPELQKKEAEAAEKEKNKMQRRREAAAAKAEYSGRGSRMGGGGLSLDDLEGRSGRLPALKKKVRTTGGSGAKRNSRKRNDYDSDEEDDRPGRHREDEYDLEDGFLAGSDEEIEADEGSEEDIDDGIIESPREKSSQPKAKKQKRQESADEDEDEDADADADADGEPDDEAPVNDVGGRRKRNVIEDDEDDE